MKRRAFIALLGAAMTWPCAVAAQNPSKVYRIGYANTPLANLRGRCVPPQVLVHTAR